MAVLIDIKRLVEEDNHADYSFTVSEARQVGILRINRTTGEVSLVRPMEGPESADVHFHRAAHKIKQHWKQGSLPEAAVWAS